LGQLIRDLKVGQELDECIDIDTLNICSSLIASYFVSQGSYLYE
jgi:hypothetical protein